MLASEWGVFNWPASVLALILGLLADKVGLARFLCVRGRPAVLLWTASFVH